ncbi:hypothetical protein Tco_1393482 [Tanacetum coccineum]
MKIEESLNMKFNETLPPSKTSPLVDDDLDEERKQLGVAYSKRIPNLSILKWLRDYADEKRIAVFVLRRKGMLKSLWLKQALRQWTFYLDDVIISFCILAFGGIGGNTLVNWTIWEENGQEEELRQLEEYMNEIDDEFMHLSLMVIEMIEEKIRAQESEKIQKITKFPDTMEFESSNTFRSLNTKTPSPYPNSSLPNQQYVRYVHTIFLSLPLVRKSTFGFKLGTKNNQNSPQVLPSFEVYTSPVTYPEEVEDTIGIPMEVEPLDHMKLEDLGINTNTHDLFLSSKGFPSVDEPEPQLLPNFHP